MTSSKNGNKTTAVSIIVTDYGSCRFFRFWPSLLKRLKTKQSWKPSREIKIPFGRSAGVAKWEAGKNLRGSQNTPLLPAVFKETLGFAYAFGWAKTARITAQNTRKVYTKLEAPFTEHSPLLQTPLSQKADSLKLHKSCLTHQQEDALLRQCI